MIVRMDSRGGKEYEVSDPLDAQFLRSADRFQMKVRAILAEPWWRRWLRAIRSTY